MTELDSKAYAEAVARVLAEEFPSLAEPVERAALVEAVAQQHASPNRDFGYIVDHPSIANWRLYQAEQQPERVQITSFNGQSAEREDRINDALRAI